MASADSQLPDAHVSDHMTELLIDHDTSGYSDSIDDGASDSTYSTETESGSVYDDDADGDDERPIKHRKSQSSGNTRFGIKRSAYRRPYAKTAREQAQRRLQKKYKRFQNHVWSQRRRHGPGLQACNVEPPATRRVRNHAKSKQQSPQRQMTLMDDNAPSKFVSKKRRIGELSRANEIKQYNNRHGDSQKRDLKEAQTIFGHGKLEAREKDGKRVSRLADTQCDIPDSQLVALAWWIKRETDDRPPHGGILGDTPGLGKTAITLNAIVGNPPNENERESSQGATLIVVPNTDHIAQWHGEILKHLGKRYEDRVWIYSANLAKGSRFTAERIGRYLIILTTYAQVERGSKTMLKSPPEQQCDLFKIQWYRLVFDEGQALKNINTKTVAAAMGLKKKHCWILSGTPIINGSEEFFPYFQLIGVPLKEDAKTFKKMLASGDPQASKKRDALVSLCSFRRISGDYCLDEPVLPLPDSQTTFHWVNLSEEERLGYNRISRVLAGRNINTIQKQAVSHPFLLYNTLLGCLEEHTQKLAKIEEKNKTVYSQLGSWDQRSQQSPPRSQASGATTRPLKPFGQSTFGQRFGFGKVLQGLTGLQDSKKVSCQICDVKPPVEPVRARACSHVFCAKCITTFINDCYVNDKTAHCSRCHVGWKGTEALVVSVPQPPSKKSGELQPGVDFHGTRPKLDEQYEALFWRSMAGDGVPTSGAKTTAVKEIVLRWNMESPEHQAIIFCEYKVTCLIIGRMLQLEDINFVYLNGDLDNAQRQNSIEAFRDDKRIRYLVSTVATGGQGLNFTNADRAIIVDPWWNEASADQAFGRVKRRGQKEETQLVRIFARNTIDSKIFEKQESKKEVIDEATHDDGHETELLNEWQAMKILFPEWYENLVQGYLDSFVD